VERPPIRPDSRRNREGLGVSLGVRLCRSPSRESQTSADRVGRQQTIPSSRSGGLPDSAATGGLASGHVTSRTPVRLPEADALAPFPARS
jgi:hypothetical protein